MYINTVIEYCIISIEIVKTRDDTSMHHNMQDSDTSKTFNVLIYRVSQCIAIIGCTDLNNMINILIILKVPVRLLS